MNQIIENISWWPYEFLSRVKSGKRFAEIDLRKVGINKQFVFRIVREDRGLSRQLSAFKLREPLNLENYWKFVEPSDVVLDLGANIGVFSVLSSKAKKIISVEPLDKAMDYLKKNLEINKLIDKSKTLRMAGGKEGWLYLEGDEKLNLSRVVEKPNKKTQKVKSEPLSYFVEKYKTNLLRIDVEGYEYEILYRKIPKKINKISIEFHTILLGKEKTKKLIDYFYKEGFKAETMIEDLPIRLYPFHGILRKTGLIKKFTFVKKNLDKKEVMSLIGGGRAQKYLFLRRE